MSNESKDQVVGAGVNVPQPGVRPRSIEERRRLVAESLRVGNPGNRARDLPEQADPRHDCQIELKAEDVRPYEHNPRRTINAKFAEIKESIRATGIRNPLTVTRRPGEKHFIVEAGGNTRLLAIQQLWAETRDPRFEKLTVLFRPWRSEAHVLTAHLIENEQRGELTFWDKANGVLALKTRFEEEKGRALSLRQLEEEFKAAGYSVSRPTLNYHLYATTRLRTLGDAIPVLSGLDVRTLQSRLTLVKRYAQARTGIAEGVLYAAVFEPVFLQHAGRYRETPTFEVSALCSACEEAFAEHLGENVTRLRMALDALAQSPQASPAGTHGPIEPRGSEPESDSREPVGEPQEPARGVYSVDSNPAGTGGDLPRAGSHAPTPAERKAVPLSRLKASVARFAELATVAECVQAWDAAPLGYYMELPRAVFEEAVHPRLAHRAWWLLARISGQFEESVRGRLPESSCWRQLGRGEGGLDPGTPAHATGGLPAIEMLDPEFFDWLLAGQDEAANACWDVLTSARASAAVRNR